MKNILFKFEFYLKNELLLSNNTVHSYISDLKQYLDFMQKYFKIFFVDKINQEQISFFLSYIHKEYKLSSKTLARKIIVIKKFYSFLILEKN